MKSQTGKEIKTNYTQPIGRTLTVRMTDDRWHDRWKRDLSCFLYL